MKHSETIKYKKILKRIEYALKFLSDIEKNNKN